MNLTINKILTNFRKKKALSQQEMADLIGINRITYIAIEKGKTVPHPKTIRLIASAIGKEPEFITQLYKGE